MMSDKQFFRLEEAFVVADHFQFQGPVVSIEPHGYGRIHKTYKVVSQNDGTRWQWVLQRLNQKVLPDLEAVTSNIMAVNRHLSQKRKSVPNPLPLLTPVPTFKDDYLHQTDKDHSWRAFEWIEGEAFEKAEQLEIVHEAARTVGRFHADLADYKGPPLATTIADFHDTAKRLELLEKVMGDDSHDRVAKVARELSVIDTNRHLAEVIAPKKIPQRIVHNDPKLNNILFDAKTQKALCLIDFDTVMPGTVLHDFGDMVRSMTNGAGEGAKPEAVFFDDQLYGAIEEGYLSVMGDLLTPLERELLPRAGSVLAFELGVRFLTDFLDGDDYFPINHPDDNLNRCRVQLAFLKAIQSKLPASPHTVFLG